MKGRKFGTEIGIGSGGCKRREGSSGEVVRASRQGRV